VRETGARDVEPGACSTHAWIATSSTCGGLTPSRLHLDERRNAVAPLEDVGADQHVAVRQRGFEEQAIVAARNASRVSRSARRGRRRDRSAAAPDAAGARFPRRDCRVEARLRGGNRRRRGRAVRSSAGQSRFGHWRKAISRTWKACVPWRSIGDRRLGAEPPRTAVGVRRARRSHAPPCGSVIGRGATSSVGQCGEDRGAGRSCVRRREVRRGSRRWPTCQMAVRAGRDHRLRIVQRTDPPEADRRRRTRPRGASAGWPRRSRPRRVEAGRGLDERSACVAHRTRHAPQALLPSLIGGSRGSH